jgi:serine/threonine protein kinase
MLVDGTSVGRSVVCPECLCVFRVESFQSLKPGTDPALPFAESCDSSDRVNESEELPLQCLGRFELRKILGKGGFGRVYLAWDPHLERLVALKVAYSRPENGKHRERVLREARAQLLLKHEAIVPALECDQIDGCLYIVFEYVEGETLSSRLRTGPVERRQAVEWVRDLADALAFAHAHRVIHRDVKPHNILIDSAGRPFITDFGLVHWLDDGGDLTKPGSFTGTIPYMAPELLSGHEQAGGGETEFYRGLDQYSLGVVLYELLTGHRPFEGRFTAVVAMKIAQDPPCPSRHDPGIPGDLAAICLKTLHRDPERRHRDCASLAMALTEWLRESEKPGPSVLELRQTNTSRNRTLKSQNRKALRLVVSALILLLVIVGIGFAWSYFFPEETLRGPLADHGNSSAALLPPASLSFENGVTSHIENSIKMTLLLIPSPEFVASSSNSNAKTNRPGEDGNRVEIPEPFYMSQLEVTVGQYQSITGKRPSRNSSRQAVGNVTYDDAVDFCRKLSEREKGAGHVYRLPTEAEWEFASQANLATSTEPDGSPFGLENLAVGVSEWCSDWYDSSRQERVVRGGSNQHVKEKQTISNRDRAEPDEHEEYRGFRVVMEIDQ